MKIEEIRNFIEACSISPDPVESGEFTDFRQSFVSALNAGTMRSAFPDNEGNWQTDISVKKGILLLFKFGKMQDYSSGGFSFFDKDTIPVRKISLEDNLRLVPGGSSIRDGAYAAKGVIMMPPMYINIGAYVDEGTMIDSHALVGTCAQIGKRVHLSAASQIGGVLEPLNADPVIVEDDVMIGGNCGVYEGTLVGRKAVLASGVILTASTKVYDLVNERVITSTDTGKLKIPPYAVVVPGARTVDSDFGRKYGLSVASPMIVKYRDDKTDSKTALNSALR